MPQSTLIIPKPPPHWPTDAALELQALDWTAVPTLPAFQVWDGSAPARWQTEVRVCADAQTLFIHFDCEDEDIWSRYTQRDDPIYDEEVVEFFIGPGADTPVDYFEFEINPNGVLFDAQIHNTRAADGHRAEDMRVDVAWNCRGARWFAETMAHAARWRAAIALPWQSLLPEGMRDIPTQWRANFYRIERPRNSEPEFSAWSPPRGRHPDFHRAGQFGLLSFDRDR